MVLPDARTKFLSGQFPVVVKQATNFFLREPLRLSAFNTFVRRLHAPPSAAGKDVSPGWKTRADKRQRDCVLLHVMHVARGNRPVHPLKLNCFNEVDG